MPLLWGSRFITEIYNVFGYQNRDTYHLEYGYSCMGYEIAAAVGAKIAAPKQPVMRWSDGSYLMLHSELQTAIQENIKVTILLFDNAGFGCINNLQMSQGMGVLVQKTATGTHNGLDGWTVSEGRFC